MMFVVLATIMKTEGIDSVRFSMGFPVCPNTAQQGNSDKNTSLAEFKCKTSRFQYSPLSFKPIFWTPNPQFYL